MVWLGSFEFFGVSKMSKGNNPYFITGDIVIRKSHFWAGVALAGTVTKADIDGHVYVQFENEPDTVVGIYDDNLIHLDSTYNQDWGHFTSPSRSRNLRCFHEYYQTGR